MRDELYIDGIGISNYSAQLISYTYGAGAVTTAYQLGKNSAYPQVLSNDIGTKALNIVLCVEAGDRYEVTRAISSITEALAGVHELQMDDGTLFRAALTGSDYVTPIIPQVAQIAYTFDAIQHDPELVLQLDKQRNIVYGMGNQPAECLLDFIAPADGDVTVYGITVKGLKQGQHVQIDGRYKTVTADGTNIFAQTDLIDFPSIRPGRNEIDISAPAPLTIRYCPTYL